MRNKKTKKYKFKLKKRNKTNKQFIGGEEQTTTGILEEKIKDATNYISEKGKRLLFGPETIDKGVSLIKKGMDSINSKIDNPEFKESLKNSINNISEIASISLDAMDKPIDKAIDKLNKAGEKATSGILSNGIRVGTDMMAAIPGIGAIVELGKIANDSSKGISAVVDASSEVAETSKDFIKEFNANFENQLKKKTELTNRIGNSVKDFQSTTQVPNEYLKGGFKSILSRKKKGGSKTKRVRFLLSSS
jgi:hypothetical protein